MNKDPLKTPIDKAGLSVRCVNVLRNLGVATMGDVMGWEAGELLRAPNFGRGSLAEIEKWFRIAGIVTPEAASTAAKRRADRSAAIERLTAQIEKTLDMQERAEKATRRIRARLFGLQHKLDQVKRGR